MHTHGGLSWFKTQPAVRRWEPEQQCFHGEPGQSTLCPRKESPITGSQTWRRANAAEVIEVIWQPGNLALLT